MENEYAPTIGTIMTALKTFELKKKTPKELVTASLTDLQDLHRAITTGQEFILAYNGKAEIVQGSSISLDTIKLSANY